MLTTSDIAKRYGVTRRTVTDRWTKRLDFPAPAKRINQRIVYWRDEDIDAWCATDVQRSTDSTLGSTPEAAASLGVR